MKDLATWPRCTAFRWRLTARNGRRYRRYLSTLRVRIIVLSYYYHFFSLPLQTERAEKEKALQESERKAKSCIQLANETVKMLRYLTSRIVAPFLRPEIIDRLAAMLNYNLVQMVLWMGIDVSLWIIDYMHG